MKKFFLFYLLLSLALFGCSQQDSGAESSETAETTAAEQPSTETTAAAAEAPARPLPTAVPVTENPDHDTLLSSDDPQLAANKKLVYDMWRTLVDANDVEAAKKYLDPIYIQHNPNADTGLEGVIAYFSALGEPKPIPDRVQGKLVAIVAEKDLVAMVWVDEQTDPRPYTTTWFDMYRIENGKIVEHWDHGTLAPGATAKGYVPTEVNPNYKEAIASNDPQLQKNKQLVYDMWRVLLDAQQVEEAPKYMSEGYIQHNPMANTGLDGFLNFFRMIAKPQPVQPELKGFINLIAEDDLVVLATVRTYLDSNGNPYNTTWFDMWVVEDDLLVEHWDTAKLAGTPQRAPQ